MPITENIRALTAGPCILSIIAQECLRTAGSGQLHTSRLVLHLSVWKITMSFRDVIKNVQRQKRMYSVCTVSKRRKNESKRSAVCEIGST